MTGMLITLTMAKPILERYDAPATLFLMTAALDTLGFRWNRTDFLPAVLGIPMLGRAFEIKADSVDRRELLVAIWNRVRELHADQRDSAIEYLADALAVPPADSALRPVTTDEVQRLEHGILSVGAHTQSRLSLPQLGPTELVREIADSKAICERFLARQSSAFAYPFGDYDERVRAAVAEAGLKLACTTVPRSVQSSDDCLASPRIGVGDWTPEQFVRCLPWGDELWG
jgi:hypothetical protein